MGVFLPKMALGNEAINVLAAWTVWLIILPLIIEILGIIFKNRKGELFSYFECN
jgi:hypothetical protein